MGKMVLVRCLTISHPQMAAYEGKPRLFLCSDHFRLIDPLAACWRALMKLHPLVKKHTKQDKPLNQKTMKHTSRRSLFQCSFQFCFVLLENLRDKISYSALCHFTSHAIFFFLNCLSPRKEKRSLTTITWYFGSLNLMLPPKCPISTGSEYSKRLSAATCWSNLTSRVES